MEPQPTTQPIKNEADISLVQDPIILPVHEVGEIFPYGEQEYIPEKLDVLEKVWTRYFDSKRNKYVFTTEIAAMVYFFRLSGADSDTAYTLSFKTLEYEYATANLDEESSVILFEKLSDFLETAYLDSEKRIKSVDISPSDASYSVEEIEDCIGQILRKTKDYSEEDLRNNFKGFRIFDLYEEIFDKNFGDAHYNSVSRANARSRYFKMKFRKFLKNWEIDDGYRNSTSFYLKRKE